MITNNLTVALVSILFASVTACNNTSPQTADTNSALENVREPDVPVEHNLVASLKATKDSYTLQDSISLEFTVHNLTTDTIRFTQYHTPFEGMISKFLTIVDTEGKEVEYIGVMAKRMMPAPEESYHTLIPGEQKSVTFSLNKAYRFDHAGTYSIQYIGEGINDIKSGEPIHVKVMN